MDIKTAERYLTYAVSIADNRVPLDIAGELNAALTVAKIAMGKQEPDKLKHINAVGLDNDSAVLNIHCYCPMCGSEVDFQGQRYCRYCGQALDWSEQEG